MLFYKFLVMLLFSIFFGRVVCGQNFFRIKADYTIKYQGVDESKYLTSGVIYYDKNNKTTVYRTSFPTEETWVTVDTVLVKVKDDKAYDRVIVPSMAEFSVFHMILSGNLTNYGLDQSDFTIEKVEKEGDMVITTWMPPAFLNGKLGKVLISTMDKKLYGIVFTNAFGGVTAKHFF